MEMQASPIVTFSSVPRSGKWPKVRSEHLEKEPTCQVCGACIKLNVHHKKPYHLYPDLELVESNLITLCEGSAVNCHFLFGHLFNWADYNPQVDADCEEWRRKIAKRLKGALQPAFPGVPFMQES